jgi:hypothetical protein
MKKIKTMRVIVKRELVEVDVIDSFIYNEFYTLCLTSYPKDKWTQYAVSDYLTGARVETLKSKKNWKQQMQPVMDRLMTMYPTGAAYVVKGIMPVNSPEWFRGYSDGLQHKSSDYNSGFMFAIQNKVK